jgi:hypothetical protein
MFFFGGEAVEQVTALSRNLNVTPASVVVTPFVWTLVKSLCTGKEFLNFTSVEKLDRMYKISSPITFTKINLQQLDPLQGLSVVYVLFMLFCIIYVVYSTKIGNGFVEFYAKICCSQACRRKRKLCKIVF